MNLHETRRQRFCGTLKSFHAFRELPIKIKDAQRTDLRVTSECHFQFQFGLSIMIMIILPLMNDQ